jgi:hypothetical protein
MLFTFEKSSQKFLRYFCNFQKKLPEKNSHLKGDARSGSPDQQCSNDILSQSRTGLPDGLFSNQNPNLGIFGGAFDWKMLIYFKAVWYILWSFGIFYDHLVHFVFIWYIFSHFGIMYQEKSGNPGRENDDILLRFKSD